MRISLWIILAFFSSGIAYADSERSGASFGLSIGRGSIDVDCDGCANVAPITEALSLTAHAGYMVSPRLALVGDVWTIRFNNRGSEWFNDNQDHLVAQYLTTMAMQLWVARHFWLKVGAGAGWHQSDSPYVRVKRERPDVVSPNGKSVSSPPSYDLDASGDISPAYFVAFGLELVSTATFAAEVQLRFGATRRPDDEFQIFNSGLNFGVTWY